MHNINFFDTIKMIKHLKVLQNVSDHRGSIIREPCTVLGLKLQEWFCRVRWHGQGRCYGSILWPIVRVCVVHCIWRHSSYTVNCILTSFPHPFAQHFCLRVCHIYQCALFLFIVFNYYIWPVCCYFSVCVYCSIQQHCDILSSYTGLGMCVYHMSVVSMPKVLYIE